MINFRTYPNVAQPVTGYELDDRFSVVVPVARTNLVTNPSLETNTTNWTAIGGSIARVTTFQYHGAYSLAITPTAATTDGARFDTVSLISGTTYAYQAKMLGIAGTSYKLALETTAGVELASRTFLASGRWQWIFGYYTETSTTTRRVTVRKNGHASTAIFYVDGVMVEALGANESVSTYLDGAQLGLVPNQFPAAYLWNGTPHGSTSSRSGLTRAGGMVIPFKSFNFLLTAIIGLGLAIPTNVATEYARIDGGYDDYTRKGTRQFTLTGTFQADSYQQLRANRGGLSELLDRDLVGQDQRLMLLRDVIDPCSGDLVAGTARVLAKYQGGLDGQMDNHHGQTVPITFTQYLPVVQGDGEAGTTLAPQISVNSSNYINMRSPTGVWSAMGTGGTGGPLVIGTQTIAIGLDGTVYAGGLWTGMSGVANTNRIARWSPITQSWSAMGTGAVGGDVNRIFVAADGSVIVGGAFTSMGGVANTSRIAKWNPVTQVWSSVTGASAANGDVNDIKQAPDGTFYIGGNFTSIGGTAANRIVKWDGNVTWTAMGTGSAAAVRALVIGPNGTDVYAGGNFTSMGGVANTGRIARWSTLTGVWNALATGLPTGGTEVVTALLFGPNALLYVAGQFATAGGVTVGNLAIWNGVTFSPMSSGVVYNPVPINGQSSALANGPQGTILVGGLFDQAGPFTLPDSMASWNGSGFAPIDIDLAGGALVTALAVAPDGTLYIGHNSTGTATAASTTTLTNTGTARTYPSITITGPTSGTSRLYSLTNVTTGRAIYFSTVLNAGETAVLVLQPDNLSFSSTFLGNIMGTIQPGSNTADFFLQPGANTIAFLAAGSTITATVNWRPQFVSLDDVQ